MNTRHVKATSMHPAARLIDRVRRLPRRARRLLVLETFIAYPLVVVGYGTLIATGRVSNVLWAPIAILLMSGFMGGVFAIYAYAGGRADPRGPTLDERQRDLAVEAWAHSFAVVTWFLALLGLAWALHVTLIGPVVLGGESILPVAIGTGVYLPLLPLAALTWIEPDALAEEAEDDERGVDVPAR